jgi:dolichol kinase
MKLVFITLLVWAMVVLMAEVLWRNHLLKGEYARKFSHILLSVSIAFLPYYLSWTYIKLIGFIGLATVVLMRLTGLFGSIYDIKRRSWGDIIGPAAVVLLGFFEPSKIVFMAAVLHTGLADGLAAIVGTRFGKGNSYKIFGYKKSAAGTTAFFLTSLVILVGMSGAVSIPLAAFLVVPIVSTAVENISPFGIDNALLTALIPLLFMAFSIA